jgi:hypothetical protein
MSLITDGDKAAVEAIVRFGFSPLEALRYANVLNGTGEAVESKARAWAARPDIKELLSTTSRALEDVSSEIDSNWVVRTLKKAIKAADGGEPIVNKHGDIVGYRSNFNAIIKAVELLGVEKGMFVRAAKVDYGDKTLDTLRSVLDKVDGRTMGPPSLRGLSGEQAKLSQAVDDGGTKH